MPGHLYKPMGSTIKAEAAKKAKGAKRARLLPLLLFLQPVTSIIKPPDI
jgi:hypothetical protein